MRSKLILLLLIIATTWSHDKAEDTQGLEQPQNQFEAYNRVTRQCGCGKPSCTCPRRPPGSQPSCTCGTTPCWYCGAGPGECDCNELLCPRGTIVSRSEGKYCCRKRRFQGTVTRKCTLIFPEPDYYDASEEPIPKKPSSSQPQIPAPSTTTVAKPTKCDGEEKTLGSRQYCCKGDICVTTDHKTERDKIVLKKVPCPATEFKIDDVEAPEVKDDEEESNRLLFDLRKCLGGEHIVRDGRVFCCKDGKCRIVPGPPPRRLPTVQPEPVHRTLKCPLGIRRRMGQNFCCKSKGCVLMLNPEDLNVMNPRKCLGGEHVERDGLIYCCRFGRCTLVWTETPRLLDEVALDVAADELDDEKKSPRHGVTCSGKAVNVGGTSFCCTRSGCMIVEGDDENTKHPLGSRICKGGKHITTDDFAYCCRYGRCSLVWATNESALKAVAHNIPTKEMLHVKQAAMLATTAEQPHTEEIRYADEIDTRNEDELEMMDAKAKPPVTPTQSPTIQRPVQPAPTPAPAAPPAVINTPHAKVDESHPIHGTTKPAPPETPKTHQRHDVVHGDLMHDPPQKHSGPSETPKKDSPPVTVPPAHGTSPTTTVQTPPTTHAPDAHHGSAGDEAIRILVKQWRDLPWHRLPSNLATLNATSSSTTSTTTTSTTTTSTTTTPPPQISKPLDEADRPLFDMWQSHQSSIPNQVQMNVPTRVPKQRYSPESVNDDFIRSMLIKMKEYIVDQQQQPPNYVQYVPSVDSWPRQKHAGLTIETPHNASHPTQPHSNAGPPIQPQSSTVPPTQPPSTTTTTLPPWQPQSLNIPPITPSSAPVIPQIPPVNLPITPIPPATLPLLTPLPNIPPITPLLPLTIPPILPTLSPVAPRQQRESQTSCPTAETVQAIGTLRKVASGTFGLVTVNILQREGCGVSSLATVRLNMVDDSLKYGIELGAHTACGAKATNCRSIVKTPIVGNNVENKVKLEISSLKDLGNQAIVVTTLDNSGNATPYACGTMIIVPSFKVL